MSHSPSSHCRIHTIRKLPTSSLVNRIAESQLEVQVRPADSHNHRTGSAQHCGGRINRQLARLNGVYKNARENLSGPGRLDRDNGHVLAMVGGRNYVNRQLNRVTDAHRQPGSTFSLLSMQAALEDRIVTGRMLPMRPVISVTSENESIVPQTLVAAISGAK